MKTALLFAGSGPLVIATSRPSLTDPTLLQQLHAKGIDKFIAYELPVQLVKERYGGHFAAEAHDPHQPSDLHIIDFSGDRAFSLFRFREFGRRVMYERDDAATTANITLRERVLDALAFEPSIHSENIGVAVEDGIVKLSGSVEAYGEKARAEEVVRQVKGIRGLVQGIGVRVPTDHKVPDEEIAKRAVAMFAWDSQIPKDAIRVGVRDGWVTLSGEVDWYYQKAAAENALHRLHGVKGINNELGIRPPDEECDIKARIESALERIAHVEADSILISVIGRTVVLEGEVNSWAEREAAQNAAWATPGVGEVDDRLQVIDVS